MGVSFVISLPLGATIIRFLAPVLPVPTRLHYLTQIFAFICILAAMGLGIYMSKAMQFIYFRTPPQNPSPNVRPNFRHNHNLAHRNPSISRMVPSPPLSPWQPLLPTLVHPPPSLARSFHNSLRARKLWIRFTISVCSLEVCYYLVEHMWCLGSDVCGCKSCYVEV